MNNPPSIDAAAVADALGGRYDISKEVGRGGQGLVLHAVRRLGKDGAPAADPVALKLYFDPAQVERVEREIAMMEGMEHPCLCDLIEHGSIDVAGQSIRYVAWEFIEGSALDTRLANGGPLPSRVVAAIGRDVATAIEEIWKYKIVHRDVNPKNIMLRTGDRNAVLIDLGIAKHLGKKPLTSQGMTWGTMSYMSPEQWRADPQLTCASDIFSLGVVLLESLLGKHPTGRNQQALVNAPLTVGALVPSAPVALANLIDKMLARRAAFRPTPAIAAQRCASMIETL
jgi:eukaryotic-like serine/threonine-protein kinase